MSVFFFFPRKTRKKMRVRIMIGFAVLMFGMETMSGAVAPLAARAESFTRIFTDVFRSAAGNAGRCSADCASFRVSSASVGILQALCVTGAVSCGAAIRAPMQSVGQNIGTCVTALISAIGAKKNAKRTAFVHLYFNLIGTIVFMILFYSANFFVHFGFF